ncbi:TraR/DksA family transcriptional regulator [Citrobacter farmeri]|uniref:TraR/DksA family transcriptional regulator n=1 Tax=Citrobacter farmeri TaxID=67824 RepID=UPI001905DF56|nr:TraR/DksA family transcriptional regulator [Citrobacter farmeri]EKV7296990.1 TraR/DksA family transcriptional regulator [Citrobacter farmeri]MBJ8746216.1 TraR/DksA family transcriptional regulator [Citrobacter farmeri]MBJ8759467.1 TraR/DksA family transcriptional regulator [Citrobacter farmeri]MBJ9016407.1 TraR/DksA family transcriptional regulator [Citrobacter farmeri]
MADLINTASEIEELLRNAALSTHRINRNAVSAEHCEDCGEDIPEPRYAAVPGCQTRVECQQLNEFKHSLFAKRLKVYV